MHSWCYRNGADAGLRNLRGKTALDRYVPVLDIIVFYQLRKACTDKYHFCPFLYVSAASAVANHPEKKDLIALLEAEHLRSIKTKIKVDLAKVSRNVLMNATSIYVCVFGSCDICVNICSHCCL